MIKKVLFTALTVLFASSVYAVPNTFSAGNTIVASEMNANFTSLEDRIAAIEAKVGIGKTYTQMLADTSYSGQFVYFGYLGSDQNGSMGGAAGTGDGTLTVDGVRFIKGGGSIVLTLNANGSITGESGAEVESVGSTIAYCTNFALSPDCPAYANNMITTPDSWNGDLGSTWSVDNATGILTIVWEGDPTDTDQFKVSDDGSVIYSLSYSNESDGLREIENSVVIMTRNN